MYGWLNLGHGTSAKSKLFDMPTHKKKGDVCFLKKSDSQPGSRTARLPTDLNHDHACATQEAGFFFGVFSYANSR